MARTPVQTDDFADNNLSAGSVIWAQLNPSIAAINNTGGFVGCAHSGEGIVRANGTYSNDQYSKLIITTLPSVSTVNWIGVVARASGDADANRDYYIYYVDYNTTPRTTRLARVSNGTFNALDAINSIAWAVSDSLEIECEGDKIRGFRNGILQVEITDANLTTGKPGISIQTNLLKAIVGKGEILPQAGLSQIKTTPLRLQRASLLAL
jgi:hypothetical protein